MFKKLKITCDQATAICNKNQYGEATFLEKLKLNIHFIRCRFCILYTKQNLKLSKIYKGHAKECQQIKHSLTVLEKEELKKTLNL